MLCRRRRAYGASYGMSTLFADLTPPPSRQELYALHEWLECGNGPPDWVTMAALQAHWMAEYRVERAAASVKWRHVPGGRASHAFVGDADVPLCGVVVVRENGMPPRWTDYPARYSRRLRGRHADCVRAAKDGGHPL
jgi:hypothetical protein